MRYKKRPRKPESYRHRYYRRLAERNGLVSTYFRLKETDLHILAEKDAKKTAGELATRYRLQVERYVEQFQDFGKSLVPLPADELAPTIVQDMLAAAKQVGVGPMAAVAGAISQYVGMGLLDNGYRDVIVENGGDIFIKRERACTIGVFAADSPLSNKVGLKIPVESMPCGVCTSSGTVGHSLSFGAADSVTVVASSTLLADAAATRLGNEIQTHKDRRENISTVLETARSVPGIGGVLVICGETMGAMGAIELVPLD